MFSALRRVHLASPGRAPANLDLTFARAPWLTTYHLSCIPVRLKSIRRPAAPARLYHGGPQATHVSWHNIEHRRR